MSNIFTILGQIPFVTGLWLFCGLVVIHELEEWNINRFERKHFEGVPAAANDRSARMVIAYMSAISLAWCCAAALSGSTYMAAWIFLPFVAFMLLNSLQHIFWSIYFKEVAPGVVSAALLIIPFGSYITANAIGLGLVPAWYAAALGAAVILVFASTAISGRRMPALIQSGNKAGIWLVEKIR